MMHSLTLINLFYSAILRAVALLFPFAGRSICLCVPTVPGEMSNVSSYALRMARLSAQIFGDVVRPTDSKSMKVVKLFSEQPLAKREEVYNWYPPHNTYYALMKKLRYFGLYRYFLCL